MSNRTRYNAKLGKTIRQIYPELEKADGQGLNTIKLMFDILEKLDEIDTRLKVLEP